MCIANEADKENPVHWQVLQREYIFLKKLLQPAALAEASSNSVSLYKELHKPTRQQVVLSPLILQE